MVEPRITITRADAGRLAQLRWSVFAELEALATRDPMLAELAAGDVLTFDAVRGNRVLSELWEAWRHLGDAVSHAERAVRHG